MALTRLQRLELAALAVAVGVRLAALAGYEALPRADKPMVDAYTFWDQASALLEGKDPFAEGYYQPPAYPYLLSWLSELAGEPSLAFVRRVQLVCGVLASVALLVVGRRLGERVEAPWVGAAAVLVFSLYRPLLQFEHDLLTPAWTGLLLSGALLLLTRPAGTRWPEGLGAGLLCGLAAALHPTTLLGGLVLGGVGALRSGRRALVGGVFALGLLAPVAPTTLDNHARFGVIAPVSLNSGVNFYLGNNPDWQRTAFLPSGLPFRQLALEAEPHRRDQAERDVYWRQRAWTEIGELPVTWLMTLATKAWWSLSDTEIPRNEDYRCFVRPGSPVGWMRFLPVRFGLVLPFLGAALVLGWRRRDRLLLGLGASWLTLHLPMVGFLVASRYRVGTWPLVAVLAPLGAALLWRERRRLVGPAGLVILVLAVVPWIPLPQVTAMDPARCTYWDGHMAYMDEQPHRARALYEEVLATHPDDMSAHWWLAQLDAREGEHAAALAHMDVVLEQFPDHFPSLRSAASWAARAGRRDAEIAYLQRAFAVPGERRSTGVKLAKALRAAGRTEELRALLAAHPEIARPGGSPDDEE